jgi:hypothetical protein
LDVPLVEQPVAIEQVDDLASYRRAHGARKTCLVGGDEMRVSEVDHRV